MNTLLLPYIANIVILVPVGLGSLFNLFLVSRGQFPESAGWRTLVGSLWTAILVGSVLGLFQPILFSPLLLLKVIYKNLWLLVYVAPRIAKPDRRQFRTTLRALRMWRGVGVRNRWMLRSGCGKRPASRVGSFWQGIHIDFFRPKTACEIIDIDMVVQP